MLVIGGGEPSAIAATIAVDAPSRQETKEGLAKVSFAFQEISAKHGHIQEGARIGEHRGNFALGQVG